MNNERIAALIGEGGNDELIPLLWENMRKLFRMWADSYYTKHKERCSLCGATNEDLRQERRKNTLTYEKYFNAQFYSKALEPQYDANWESISLQEFKEFACAIFSEFVRSSERGRRNQRGRFSLCAEFAGACKLRRAQV